MDDKPNKEEPKKDFNKLDLTQLGSFSFGTQWSQEKPQSGGAGQRSQGDRPRRDGPRDDRKDRRGFKRPGGPGREGGPGGRPGSGDRPQGGDRPSGGERGPGGGQGQPRGCGRDTRAPFRGDSRREGGYNQAPMGPYISPYFDATFYPEDVSFDALAKTIRASCRTFELFDIAKTVIAKNDRFVVVLERKPAKDPAAPKRPFYVSVPDSVPFETEEEAVNHVMTKHLGRFFSSEQVETDPPKGSFQVINKCGVTGELLGPPNYHLYNQTVQQHHATHLPRMPFDAFKNRIESVREPEVIEAWLELMKKVTRYTWVGGDKPAATVAPTEASAPVTEVEADASAEAEVSVAETEAVDSDTPAPAPVAESITFDSVAEAKVFLLTKVRDKVVRAYEHGRFHGRELENMPDSEIKRAVIGALERQQRFPLDSANALRGRLRREGFTIFKKGSKGVSFVCAVKRKFRVPGQTFADSIDQLITFIETHPMVKVSSLAEKFLKISTVKEEEKKPVAPVTEEPATEAEAPVAAPVPNEIAPAVPESTKTAEPETVELSAADQARIKRMNLDLRWLVTEGYVTEFIDGSLFAAAPIPPAKPKPATTPKPKPEAKIAPAAEVSAETDETPGEASSTSAEVTPEGPSEAATIVTEPSAPAEPVEPAEPATEATPESEAPDSEVASETSEPSAVEAPTPESPIDAPAEPVEPPAARRKEAD